MADFAPAAKGDLCLATITRSTTYLRGPSEKKTTYQFRRVTNVTRDGHITGYAYRNDSGEFQQKPRAGITYPCLVVSQKVADVAAAYAALATTEFETIEDARDAIRAYKIQKNPRGKTFDYPTITKTVDMGKIRAIEYASIRDGKVYRHEFAANGSKDSRPHLSSTPDGKQLVIVGGRYRVTERGIEDE